MGFISPVNGSFEEAYAGIQPSNEARGHEKHARVWNQTSSYRGRPSPACNLLIEAVKHDLCLPFMGHSTRLPKYKIPTRIPKIRNIDA
jgi:hypothetical protein